MAPHHDSDASSALPTIRSSSDIRQVPAGTKTLVLKVGTSTLMCRDGDEQRLQLANVSRLVEVIASLMRRGYQVVLVSSGAVGLGCKELGLKEKPSSPSMKRAVAGVGQSKLMRVYSELFDAVGLRVAQLLVSQRDFLEQQRWERIRETVQSCFESGVLPVINENDATNTDGLRFGDNDNLAALTAVQLEASGLFLFTDVDFLYTANPRVDPTASPMRVVGEPFKLVVDTGAPGSSLGTGGMATKVAAARTAHLGGVPCGILHGKHPERLFSFLGFDDATCPGDDATIEIRSQASNASTGVSEPEGTYFKAPDAEGAAVDAAGRWVLSLPIAGEIEIADDIVVKRLLKGGVQHLREGIFNALPNGPLELRGLSGVPHNSGVRVMLQGTEIARAMVNFNGEGCCTKAMRAEGVILIPAAEEMFAC